MFRIRKGPGGLRLMTVLEDDAKYQGLSECRGALRENEEDQVPHTATGICPPREPRLFLSTFPVCSNSFLSLWLRF